MEKTIKKYLKNPDKLDCSNVLTQEFLNYSTREIVFGALTFSLFCFSLAYAFLNTIIIEPIGIHGL